jgi:hypothetical protein
MKSNYRQHFISAALAAALALVTARAADVTPCEAKVIAGEGFIYGLPIVDSYRIEYGYFVDKKDPEYKGPWNKIHNGFRLRLNSVNWVNKCASRDRDQRINCSPPHAEQELVPESGHSPSGFELPAL